MAKEYKPKMLKTRDEVVTYLDDVIKELEDGMPLTRMREAAETDLTIHKDIKLHFTSIAPPSKPTYHHVFISAQEFLTNGGKLKKGRDIFIVKKEAGMMEYQLCGQYVRYDSGKELHIMRNMNAEFPMGLVTFYVKINVTPIYQ